MDSRDQDLSGMGEPSPRSLDSHDTLVDGAAPVRSTSWSPGRLLGPYCLLAQIGRGGMGEIWSAEDTRLGRKVALKLLPPEVAWHPRSKARFLQEARAASALDHPNICSIYEAGETADRQLYLVMPCYEGEPLRERIARGPLPLSEVLDLAGQIAKGLAEAHRKGIVHRDIKPENLMITGDGTLKILDFGIAKLSGVAGITSVGAVVGTLAYMSPEQLQGGAVDARSDLWSLGVVIYEMLTGRHPFSTDHEVATRESILHARPAPPKRHRPEVSPHLEKLVTALLEKDPADRIPSAERVMAALRDLAGKASWIPPWFRLGKTGRRLGAVLIILGLVLGIGFAFRRQEASPGSAAITSVPTSTSSADPADQRKSVAVLSFRNLSKDRVDPWLGPALSEMLTAELAAGGKFRVVPNERTAQAWKALGLQEPESLGRTDKEHLHALLGADLAVMGTVLPIGDPGRRQIRLDLLILTMPDGERVTSFSLDGNESQLIDLVAQAGSQLRSVLGFSLPTSEERLQVRGLLPAGSDAIRLYVEGLSRLRSYDLIKARDLLLRAESLEPKSVVIQSALAEVWTMLGQDVRAHEAALRAFRGRQSLPQETQLLIEARFHESGKQWDRASGIYRSLQTLFPDELEYGLKLVETLSMAGRGNEALAVLGALRERPAPEGDDPRIDLAEVIVTYRIPDLGRMEKAAERIIDKGRRLGAGLVLARGLLYHAYFESLHGRFQQAIEALRQAEDLALRAGDRLTAGRVDGSLAMILYQQGDLDGSERMHRRALATARELGTIVGSSYELFYLGQLDSDQGNLKKSRDLLEESLTDFKKIDYRSWEARANTVLARIDLAEGDALGARQRLAEALAASRSIRHSESEAIALLGMAELEGFEGRLDEARRLQHNTLQILTRLRNPRIAVSGLTLSADLLARTGDVILASRRLAQAEAASRRAAHRLLTGRLLGVGARFALRGGDLGKARSQCEEQLRIGRESRSRPLEAFGLLGLANTTRSAGDIGQAHDLAREALDINETNGDRLAAMEASLLLVRLDLDRGGLDSALVSARQITEWNRTRDFVSEESRALALAAEALLRLGRPAEAREAAVRARALAPEMDRELRLEIAPALARVEAQGGNSEGALRELDRAVAEAGRLGFVPVSFENRLARGEILMKRGETAAGRTALEGLQREAESKGFRLISRWAADLLASK